MTVRVVVVAAPLVFYCIGSHTSVTVPHVSLYSVLATKTVRFGSAATVLFDRWIRWCRWFFPARQRENAGRKSVEKKVGFLKNQKKWFFSYYLFINNYVTFFFFCLNVYKDWLKEIIILINNGKFG